MYCVSAVEIFEYCLPSAKFEGKNIEKKKE
jgi:hypothetical protein